MFQQPLSQITFSGKNWPIFIFWRRPCCSPVGVYTWFVRPILRGSRLEFLLGCPFCVEGGASFSNLNSPWYSYLLQTMHKGPSRPQRRNSHSCRELYAKALHCETLTHACADDATTTNNNNTIYFNYYIFYYSSLVF